MAILRQALTSKTASATLGRSVNYWVERRVASARRPGRKPGAPSSRQAAIQIMQRDLFDRWHDLTEGQRDAWRKYARLHWRGRGAFGKEHSGIYCFSSCNLYLVDYGVGLRVDPPVDAHVPVPLRLVVARSVPAGYLVVSYDLGSVYGAGDFCDVWISRGMISGHEGVRYPGFVHAAYAPWVTGPGTLLPVRPGLVYGVRVRGVSAYGVTSGVWASGVCRA